MPEIESLKEAWRWLAKCEKCSWCKVHGAARKLVMQILWDRIKELEEK